VARRVSEVDLVRAFDVGLSRADDPHLLEWAAAEGRILLTHDVNTIPRFAYDRVRAGLAMPGVFLISGSMPIGQAIDEVTFVIEGSSPDDLERPRYLLPSVIVLGQESRPRRTRPGQCRIGAPRGTGDHHHGP